MNYCFFSSNIPSSDDEVFQLHDNIYSLYPCKEKQYLEDYIVFFEGIIYNLKEIKEMVNVTDDVDIEVILVILFEKYGDKCINILDGAYSMVIINKKGDITLFRDIDGLENLYYYRKGDSFIVSNTIKDITKFIKPEVNVDILPKYFLIGHVYDERTFFYDIYRVKVYEVLKYIAGKWTSSILCPDFLYLPLNDKRLNDEEIENEIEKILTNRLKFLTDMFPGDKINTLSGGTDSSLIQYILKKLGYDKSYCANVQNYGRDAEYSRGVAHHLDSNHKIVDISIDDLLKSLVRGIEYCESPNVFVGEAKHNYMFGKINESRTDDLPILGFEGTGAEQILGHSYPLLAIKYFKLFPSLLSRLFNDFLVKFISKKYYLKNKAIIAGINSNEFSSDLLCTIWTDINTRKCIRKAFNLSDLSFIFETEAKKISNFKMNIIEKYYRVLLETVEVKPVIHIVHQIAKRDNIFITFPFRDANLIKFLFNVPTERKITYNTFKYFEKKLLSRYIPKKLVYRKKIGENIPYQELFRNNNRFVCFIKEIKKANYKYFDLDLDKLFYEKNYEDIALRLITFHIWHELFIDNVKYEDIIKNIFSS